MNDMSGREQANCASGTTPNLEAYSAMREVHGAFKVQVGRIKGVGFDPFSLHPGRLLINQDGLRIESEGKAATGALTGAIAGGLVGAAIGAAMDNAMASPGNARSAASVGKVFYDPAKQRFDIEMCDGQWVMVLPPKKTDTFGDILAALQAVYGPNIEIRTLRGRMTMGQFLLILFLVSALCLMPGLGLVTSPIYMIIAITGAVIAKKKKREAKTGFLVTFLIIAVVGLFLNLFVYGLGGGGTPLLP